MVYVREVCNEDDLERFIQFPFLLYKNSPYWVPPLIREVRELFSEKNPFWKHAEKILFIAVDEKGDIKGRISAVIDHNYNYFWNEKVGFFGFFESVNDLDVAKSLFDSACSWLNNRGIHIIRGPVNPSMNDECGFLLEGYDKDPVIMMPYTYPYYIDLATNCGFRKAKDLYSLIKYISQGIPERISAMIRNIEKKTNVFVRPLDIKKFDRDISILKEIYNSAWEKNWGFVPMTDEEITKAAYKLKTFVDPELVLFAYVNGNAVGVSVTIPDINPILKIMNGKSGILEILKFLYYKKKIKGLRSLIGGVKKEYRNTGIIALLYYYTEIAASKKGYEWCELGWNLEDNILINRFDQAIGGKIYKKYRIFEKEI